MLIVFLGVDGSGKSTLIDGSAKWLQINQPTKRLHYFHFCPTPRYNSGKRSVVSDPHGKLPYNFFVALIKDFFFVLEFIKGRIIVNRLLNKGDVVVIDRYYYDILIDPIRYRLSASKLREWLASFIQKPNVVFYCVGDPIQIYNRKKETSIEQIDQQQKRIQKLKLKFQSHASKWIEINTTENDIDSSMEIISQHLS